MNDVYRIRWKVHRRSVCSDFERNRAIRNLRILRWRISFINLSREYIFFFYPSKWFPEFYQTRSIKKQLFPLSEEYAFPFYNSIIIVSVTKINS